MENNVTSLVLRMNNTDYPGGVLMAVNCENAAAIGTYWRVPVTGKGVHTSYKWVLIGDGSVTKPTADSVKVLHIKNNVTHLDHWIALTDGGSVTLWNDRCGACCGTVTPMPVVVIPDVIAEETACPDADGNRNFFAITQALAAGQIYQASATIDGVALLATPPEGFASLAALETWADTNWAPSTTAISGTKVTLTSATATTGSLSVVIRALFESNAPGALTSGQHYTLAATINGIVLAPIVGVADAALSTIATAANANAAYAAYGVWSVVAGKVRLVSSNASTAALVVTKS